MHRNEAAIIIISIALAKQGDNGIGSVCLSVSPLVCTLLLEPFDLRTFSCGYDTFYGIGL